LLNEFVKFRQSFEVGSRSVKVSSAQDYTRGGCERNLSLNIRTMSGAKCMTMADAKKIAKHKVWYRVVFLVSAEQGTANRT
jgi:hypothetical protein